LINDPIRPEPILSQMTRAANPSPPASDSARDASPSPVATPRVALPAPVFHDPKHHIKLYQGDCLEILSALPESCVDLIFADPPYFLSNGGITCHAGKMVSVNKGEWDRSRGAAENHEFNRAWLAACQRVLKPDGSIWVSGTSHVIHSVGFAMQQLGFKLLNDISWVKPNPPPNLSCRYFTHATETIIWAARDKKSRHKFNYKLMKQINAGRQMKSVWTDIFPPAADEKRFGKHPAQKPLALIERILLASSNEGDLVLDPFLGSGTVLIAALRVQRRVMGCELELQSLSLSLRRICSELVQVDISVSCLQFSLDLFPDPMDRSNNTNMSGPISAKLVRRERNYYFIGSSRREVIYSASAESLEEAWRKFTSSSQRAIEVLFIIKTETEIYLRDGT
jgi:site-specific DNA-methyltransferase (adenine-specific)